MITLAKVRTDLLCHQLDDQLMVYDPTDETIHLLDVTTACVFRLLQEGGRNVDEVIAELAVRTGFQPSPGLLLLALDELRHADLLDETLEPRRAVSGASLFRRAMLKKVVAAGATAMLVPAIVTLSPSQAAAQGSCLAHDACCNTASDICCNAKDTCVSDKKCGGFKCH